jgi:hypothetical protein
VVGGTAGLLATRLLFAYVERNGVSSSGLHRRRLDAVAAAGGVTGGAIAYLLLA